MTGEALYHVDGDLVDAQSAVLHVDHRGVVFGDAVTATVRTAGGTPFAWDRHATRLFDACDAVGIDPDVDEATLRDRIEETLAANDLEAALADLSIVRGRGRGDTTATRPLAARYAPGPDTESTVVVRVTPVAETHRPITLQTVRTRSIPPDAVPASHLTHNRLDAVRASAELRRAAPPDGDPADEALVLDDEGTVVGGTASDPGFVDADAIRLPALGDRTPRTVMRSVVLDVAREEGFPVVEGEYTPADVREAEEAFVVDPAAGVRPVARLDGVPVGGGPVTALLSRLLASRIEAGGDAA